MLAVFESVDLRSADAVVAALVAGALANRTAPCRRGSIDVIDGAAAPSRLIATGDLHDNPVHLARAVELAGMGDPADAPTAHLTLHEVIHSDRLVNGVDLSYAALVRVALVKAAFPAHCHTLLANHELAQIVGAGIIKDGANVCALFNEGVEWVFGGDASRVQAAIGEFIRSMPLALRIAHGPGTPDTLCAHSLPDPMLMDRFDPDVLGRDLAEADYAPRRGSAHLMVWGRAQTADQLRTLSQRWNVGLFLLGHEKADRGVMLVPPNAVVINSDHAEGKYIPLPLATAPTPELALSRAASIAPGPA
ncbi:MAG: hypothetical protein KIT68_06715 [Phycisphaeraceae bacterium]|nr:hypothetical protein [Phycisphaeraceae bacterium]